MGEIEDGGELLFFDTFSHESDTDINLDLVQFPKPVFITQVRIIPLGARVQADFPGGVRLGATNPSKFHIEFFVNDLGISGASTFENLGHLQYNQNDCIHLECNHEKIPTDGLVLRGWYSTITLAVYGILTNTLTDNIVSSPPPPSEPEVLENVNNVNGESRSEILPDESLKNEWKENATVELSAHAHKSTVSDFVNDDMDYDDVRPSRVGESHYGRLESGDERERERHTRKRSPSSEHSSATRTHTRAESNEREYLRSRDRDRDRDKTSQEWSRSPDYSRRIRHKKSDCTRSDLDESHKWPRTPPVSIESPLRPRSPDYSEDDSKAAHYKKLKKRSFKQSTESLNTVGAIGEPVGTPVVTTVDDESRDTPIEQYEPILSDDEIIGDNIDEDSIPPEDSTVVEDLDLDLQAAADEAKPAIFEFDPFQHNLQKFNCKLAHYYTDDVENLKLILKKFALQTKCESITEFKDSNCTAEERENFVFLCEELITQLIFLTQNFKRRKCVLLEFCSCKTRLKKIYNVLYIAADFECACSQSQPVFKIRHIKTGAKLIELLASYDDLYKYLLQVEHYDPFNALLTLLKRDYMALSIKLLLLKAIYALLDSKIALRQFLSPDINGYRLILDLLQTTRLTRTKYALQALIKKLHLHESLSSMRELCLQLFVLCNYNINATDSYQTLDAFLQQILDALSKNSLLYQQPRRFLPVSKKFDLCIDPAAQRSFSNSLQAYFQQHALAESLLLILSNASTLPDYLLLSTLDVLEALLHNHFGIDYFVDDCFDVTQLLVAVLLGIDDIPADENESDSLSNLNAIIKTPKSEESKDSISIKEEESQLIEPSATSSNEMKPVLVKPIGRDKSGSPVLDTDMKSSEPMQINTGEKSSPVDGGRTTNSTEIESLPAIKTSISYLNRMQKLGFELAYKCQTRYHLDAIVYHSYDNDDYDFVILSEHLHALYSQTCHPFGRLCTVEIIGLNNNMQVLMDLIKKEQQLQTQKLLVSPGTKYKSPVLSYAVDVIDCCVRFSENLDYLIEHSNHILQLAKNHDGFEPSVSAVLQEMFVYMKPLESINILAYDDLTSLVEVINRSLEYITSFPGDLIMALRILRYLAIGSMSKSTQNTDGEQLKHRYVVLQFYAADGLQFLTQILEKLYTYFEQPGLHAPALMTMQGVYCCQIILPTLQIMREMISFAIQCRDTEFKDLTAIDHLMRTYYLLYHFPANSQGASEAALARQEIIQILLAYTQPNEQHVDALHKSLWTQMIREVLKNIDAPATLMPGLLVLTELLPLPLPMPLPLALAETDGQFIKTQAQRLITERKLWSAHIHPQSLQITRLLETISSTSFPQLADLFTRVCLQLADLAPNLTLLISKTLSDLVTDEWSSAQNQPTAQLARLLQFYGRLNAYACLKISTMSTLSGKLWDLFHSILNIKASTDEAVKCQTAVHRIIERFFDPEISFVAASNPFANSVCNPLLILASVLPPKELIPKITEALFNNLMHLEVSHEILLISLRNLTKLTDHDVTFYHLSSILKQKSADFQQWLFKVLEMNESLSSYNANIESVVVFLRSLIQIEDNNPIYRVLPKRTLKLNGRDLIHLLGVAVGDTKLNAILRIRTILERYKNEINDSLLNDIQQIGDVIAAADATCDGNGKVDEEALTEPVLPQTESIVTQYDVRPIFCSYETMSDEMLLSSAYWLQPLNISLLSTEELQSQNDRIACDLSELAQAYLPQDANLTTDCKRVLHLSASPQSNRERTPAAPCFRTRRVEVEPTTGRPEKKIFVSAVRGRGFIRTPPSRGDLFRSRPPNTSRPPSLHVDDFLALETCGAQPTGPTGYNKIPTMIRSSRIGRNRGGRIAALSAYRKAKILRTGSPSTWNEGSPMHYIPPGGDTHYPTVHFSGRSRGRGSRPIRPYLR